MQSSVVDLLSRPEKGKGKRDSVQFPCDIFIVLKHFVGWHVDTSFIFIFLLMDFPHENVNFLLWVYNPTPMSQPNYHHLANIRAPTQQTTGDYKYKTSITETSDAEQ